MYSAVHFCDFKISVQQLVCFVPIHHNSIAQFLSTLAKDKLKEKKKKNKGKPGCRKEEEEDDGEKRKK